MAGAALFVVGVASLAASMALLYALYPGQEPPEPAAVQAPAGTSVAAGLPEQVTVGHLVSLTGDAGQDGRNVDLVVGFAASDFNARPGAEWALEFRTEDTATDPATALQKISGLREAGILNVIGPVTSANLGAVLGEADEMVMISCCSSAPSLAVEDGAFRMTPDDSREALALSALIASSGAEAVVPVWRGDLWGDGFKEPTMDALESAGVRVEPGFRYDPADHRFDELVPALAEALGSAGPGAAAVVFGFDEVDGMVDMAAARGGLDGHRWFGTGVNTQDGPILDDPARREFLSAVEFTTVHVLADENPVQQRLQDYMRSEAGLDNAHVFLSGAYDSVWLLGLAIEEAQSADPAAVREALPRVADSYEGALGAVSFNAAGDLDSSNYEYWLAGPEGARSIGWYEGSSGLIYMDSRQVQVSDSVAVAVNGGPDGP